MSDIILKAEHISKQYRLGQVGLGSLGHDVNRFWHKIRGKEDPYLTVGSVNDRSAKASSDYVWALQDINFEVKRGEVLGIIGKNGAGKSTLLKILSRVTAPTKGNIKTAGRIASLLEVGTGMHPELTGRENIFLNGAILGMTKVEISSKIDEIIEFSGCEMYIDTPVKRYSSGMRVRLGFAVAAFLEPEILVVDEVLAVGDAEFQKKAIGKMQDISNEGGRTVLFVSHNMGSVQSLCSRCILLEDGKLVKDGKTEEVINYYLSGSKESHVDLYHIKDRKGRGNVVFSKLTLNDKKSHETVFKLGDFLNFNFEFKIKKDIVSNNFRIIVGVYNIKEEGILRFDSQSQGALKFKENGITKITCSLEDHLTIMPGRYTVNVALFNDGILEDYLVGKVAFDIVNDNYLGSSRMLDTDSLSKVLYKHSWS
ncbi:polysaccharide ABC transporter ATP-binding protein [uncultured Dokdonia sp.]|uniref:ABC transporter ATP-binding protein n=1 Tax=uncultured Dokdonia sp. TaxID=575653 RepID=UPI002606CEDC|nr:polysaccharide ABC transporter ATP-binding protein [uncultured Dokdonia sp.]